MVLISRGLTDTVPRHPTLPPYYTYLGDPCGPPHTPPLTKDNVIAAQVRSISHDCVCAGTGMTSHSPPTDILHDGKEREERLASLSGAMALARLSHQVKELELQKDQQEKLTKPTFSHINCVVYCLPVFKLI